MTTGFILSIVYLIILFNNIEVVYQEASEATAENEQCSIENCTGSIESISKSKYNKEYNVIHRQIEEALRSYVPCTTQDDDANCTCHAAVIDRDLDRYNKDGITSDMLEDAAKYGTRYKIFKHHLYRDENCMFPARCAGIEYFVLGLLPELDDMDLVVNTRDWPQLRTYFESRIPVFSFSKTKDYSDIIYPAWTFWAGGPAISLHPTGIGRWDLLRASISQAAAAVPWSAKQSRAFFRGSRTSDERDSLVLLSRRLPKLVDAQYTKNQAWKSLQDTLNADPAQEVSFEDHCRYKYLFNFRGVAASFRLKHLFLCKSLVFHVGADWEEFFYPALTPWVHYVPLKSYPTEQELEHLILFFRNNDELAQEIAERGYEFIWRHLRMEDVQCYWKRLLTHYQRLLQYEVVEDSSLIEIKPPRKK